MKSDFHINGTTMTVALEGRLDTLTAPELQKAFKEYPLAEMTEIVMDFSKTVYISSAGLRVLIQAYRGMKKGGVLRVINANDITKKVFEVTGFDSIFIFE